MIAQATWNGEVIAETTEWEEVENNVYFPQETIKKKHFTETEHTTTCPWKGKASYYDITVKGQTNTDAAWTYKDPKPDASHIKKHVAFWKGVNVTIHQENTQDTSIETITPQALQTQRENNDDLVIIDVLQPKYFHKQHIPGAINIPEEHAVETIQKRFHKKRQLIIYCYDSDCLKSEHVTQKLTEKGYTAKDLDVGIQGWKQQSLPITSTY